MRVAVGLGALATAGLLVMVLGLAGLTGSLLTDRPTPAGPASIENLRSPMPFVGPSTGCTEDDPTTSGCLTLQTRHLYDQLVATFGPTRARPPDPRHHLLGRAPLESHQ
jgi:hypothetical protein